MPKGWVYIFCVISLFFFLFLSHRSITLIKGKKGGGFEGLFGGEGIFRVQFFSSGMGIAASIFGQGGFLPGLGNDIRGMVFSKDSDSRKIYMCVCV